jgi:hypothetical protein
MKVIELNKIESEAIKTALFGGKASTEEIVRIGKLVAILEDYAFKSDESQGCDIHQFSFEDADYAILHKRFTQFDAWNPAFHKILIPLIEKIKK